MLSITEKEFNEKMNKYEKRECKKPYLKAKNTFTLGNLPYILCDKFSKDISEDEKKKEKYILDKYIESILKDKYKKDAKIIFVKPYLNNDRSFLDICEDIRNNYRNKAAHTNHINKKKAQKCYDMILGKIEDENLFSGILLQLLEVLK